MAATKTSKTAWAVYYTGAPYGLDETGEIVSRHRTEEAAYRALAKFQSNPRYYGSNSTVRQVAAK